MDLSVFIAVILCVLQKKNREIQPINIVFLIVVIPYFNHYGDERISTETKKYHKHAAAH